MVTSLIYPTLLSFIIDVGLNRSHLKPTVRSHFTGRMQMTSMIALLKAHNHQQKTTWHECHPSSIINKHWKHNWRSKPVIVIISDMILLFYMKTNIQRYKWKIDQKLKYCFSYLSPIITNILRSKPAVIRHRQNTDPTLTIFLVLTLRFLGNEAS
jgi:hypothetical protein